MVPLRPLYLYFRKVKKNKFLDNTPLEDTQTPGDESKPWSQSNKAFKANFCPNELVKQQKWTICKIEP